MINNRFGAASILVAVLLPLVAVATLSGPAEAQASLARYVFEKCDTTLPEDGATAGAFWSGLDQFAAGNNCREAGGYLALYQGETAGPGDAAWNLPMPAPAGGFTESLTADVIACNGAAPVGQTRLFVAGIEVPASCTAQVRTIPLRAASGLTALLELHCDGRCEPGPVLWGRDFAATEVDQVAPAVTETAGTLLAGDVLRGHQTITAHFGDEGGGLSSVGLRINGLSFESPRILDCRTAQVDNPSVVGTVALQPMPCPASAEASWTLDTQLPPFREGANSVQLCANDFATIGSPNETCLGKTVEVDNSCAESPVPGGATLSAAFKGNGNQKITVARRRPTQLTGALVDATGAPVAGGTLCIETRVLAPGAIEVSQAPILTDAGGHFSYSLAPGPNREVMIGYRRDAQQLEGHLRYLARPHPTLTSFPELLRNGDSVHFRGELPGPGQGGRVVILQANVVGSDRWITFRKATTGERRHFKADYHFTSTTHTTNYRFRAVVPHQAGYPWVQGISPAVAVIVHR